MCCELLLRPVHVLSSWQVIEAGVKVGENKAPAVFADIQKGGANLCARAPPHTCQRTAHARLARRRGRPRWRPRTSARAQTVVRLEWQGAVRSARRAAVLEGGAITAVKL